MLGAASMAANRSGVTAGLIGRGRRVLDIGCGHGGFLDMIRERFDERFGVEIDGARARTSHEHGHHVARVDLDRTGLPFRGGVFDTVVMLDVLEHVREPLPILQEACRVLRPGGEIFVSTPNIRYWKHVASILLRGTFPRTSDDPSAYDGGHLHYFTFADVEGLMARAGFRELNREPVLDPAKYRRASRFVGGHMLREFFSGGLIVGGRRP